MGASSCTQPAVESGYDYSPSNAFAAAAPPTSHRFGGEAAIYRPGMLVDLWSKSEGRWLPGRIAEPRPSDQPPGRGAVFCAFDDENAPGTVGKRKKWVLPKDVAGTIRPRQSPGTPPTGPHTDLGALPQTDVSGLPQTDPGATTMPPPGLPGQQYPVRNIAAPPAPPRRQSGIRASLLTPGMAVEVWSKQEGQWMPARIGALHEAHVPKPDPTAVLVLFTASNGLKGSKWVREQDVPTVLRLPPGREESFDARGYQEPQTWLPPVEADARSLAAEAPQTRPPEDLYPQTRPPEEFYPQPKTRFPDEVEADRAAAQPQNNQYSQQAEQQQQFGRGLMNISSFGFFGMGAAPQAGTPSRDTSRGPDDGGANSTQASQPMGTRLGGYDADGRRW